MKKIIVFIFSLTINLAMFAEWHRVCINGIAYELYYGDGKGAIAEVLPNISTSGDTLHYSGEVYIPSSVKWDGWTWTVKSIGEKAFANCTQLTSLSIPPTVEDFSNAAIYNCPNLSRVNYDPIRVTAMATNNFELCPLLNAPILGSTVFVYMPKSYKGKFQVPNGIKEISIGAFKNCENISEVKLPNTLELISTCAFEGCSSLKKIEIPSDVKIIYPKSFKDCKSLSEIGFPYRIEKISSDAFRGCTSLTSVVIPSSVKTIEDGAFYNCSSLKTVTFEGEIKNWGSRYAKPFGACRSLKEIHVPYFEVIHYPGQQGSRQELIEQHWAYAVAGNNATIIMPEPNYISLGISMFATVVYDNGKKKTRIGELFSPSGRRQNTVIRLGNETKSYEVERNTRAEYKGVSVSSFAWCAKGDGFMIFFND